MVLKRVGFLTVLSVLLKSVVFTQIRVYFRVFTQIRVYFRVYFRVFTGFVTKLTSLLFGPQYLIKNGENGTFSYPVFIKKW